MQRIFNVDKWATLEVGKSIGFPSHRPRVVRLETNSRDEVALYLATDDDEIRFLALVKGRETVEFVSPGKFALLCEGGSVNLYTADGDDISFVNLAPVIFTKIAERRKRSPELEYIAAMMQANLNRRMEQQRNELEALFERRERERAGFQLASPASAAKGAGGKPEQAGSERPAKDVEVSDKRKSKSAGDDATA